MAHITIAQYSLLEIFWYIVIFSFLGWVLEVTYRYYHDKTFINRGFLHGPFCPIYGFGIALIFICTSYLGLVNFDYSFISLIILFLVSFLLTTILEFIVGYLLMLFFKQRWWDYSNLKYNLFGYISLKFSFYWGIGGTILYLFLDKLKLNQGINLTHPIFDFLTFAFIVYFTIDFTKSIDVALRLKKFTAELRQTALELRSRVDALELDLDYLKLEAAIRKDKIEDYFDELSHKVGKIRSERRQQLLSSINHYQSLMHSNRIKAYSHILRAFPNIKNLEDESLFDTLKDRLDMPRIKISITHKEKRQVIYDNIVNAKVVKLPNLQIDEGKVNELISSRDGWPNLSMNFITINSSGKITKTKHKQSHLYYVIKGSGTLCTKDYSYSLEENSYIYLPRGIDHTIKCEHKLEIISIIPNEANS
jgi:uncharacterized membrane protein/quercetin dioxygenase-like cupin family protein